MPRYFIEVAYKGTNYSGFQIQENAPTIQSELENAIRLFQKENIALTGSSRTDAGVHAFQNYFHFDLMGPLHHQFLYKVNAILPRDIAVRHIWKMSPQAHSRFDAIGRVYEYHINTEKDPFLQETSFYYPYKLNYDRLQEAAAYIKTRKDFTVFSKTNTQVRNFTCTVNKSEWIIQETCLTYQVEANRFLRGMVRLLTGTILKIGRGKMSMDELRQHMEANKLDNRHAVPAHGLFLKNVIYPDDYFNQ